MDKLAQVALAALLAGLASAGPVGSEGTVPAPEDLDLFVRCNRLAETVLIEPGDAAECAQAFLRVKLAFVPDVDVATYALLSPSERAEANRRGYDGYRAWVEGALLGSAGAGPEEEPLRRR